MIKFQAQTWYDAEKLMKSVESERNADQNMIIIKMKQF